MLGCEGDHAEASHKRFEEVMSGCSMAASNALVVEALSDERQA